MRFSVLSSGSKANCTFVETVSSGRTVRLLIDCGLSGKEAAKRLERIGVSASSLDAILVTHEHRDHVVGVPILSRRYKLPVYTNLATSQFLDNLFGLELFQTGSSFEIEGVEVSSFGVVHDAHDPVGFTLQSNGVKLGHLTDSGRATTVVKKALEECHAVVLESNHDPELLQICDYPWQLKQRIASSHGHLSNPAAVALLQEVWHDDLQHVVLAHLSENSNTPYRALEEFRDGIDTEHLSTLVCGAPHEQTELIDILEQKPLAVAV